MSRTIECSSYRRIVVHLLSAPPSDRAYRFYSPLRINAYFKENSSRNLEHILTQHSIYNITILLDFMQPSFYVCKALAIRDIIDDYDPMRAPVVP